MIVNSYDYRIEDIAKAGKVFMEESSIGLTYDHINMMNSLHDLYQDFNSALIVDYTGDTFNGFAIISRDNNFHVEYLGYISKFYVLPERRLTKAPFRLMQDVVDWFDYKNCIKSFATATAYIDHDPQFVKLLNRFGYEQSPTGILTRKNPDE